MQKIILHIDFDSFFASVEQQANPLLRNKPIGVTATNGRTCVIAASREAKRYGVKTGTRTYDAIRLCPKISFIPADFVKYWDVSKKFLKVCTSYSPFVEVFSIDEVFIDATLTAELFGGVDNLILKIKKRLKEELGECITASFGISHNKLLAKLASGVNKPDGVYKISPEDVIQTYSTSKLTDICGVGERIKERLNQMGIYTLLHLRTVPAWALIAEFGNVEGKFLKDIGMGIDNRSVQPYQEAPGVKSVGRNYCLPENEYDTRKILQNVYELCEEVAIKLRRLEKKTRTVGLYLRGDQNFYGRHTFGFYIDTGKEIFDSFLYLLQTEIKGYVRQISVWASNLEDAKNIPIPLFLHDQRRQKVTKTIDEINEKFGDHTIRNGFLLTAPKLTTVPNGYLADRYERIKLAADAH